MDFNGINIGYAITGSFCTIDRTLEELSKLAETKANIIPIISESVSSLDTRFNKAEETINQIEEITGNKVFKSITDSEPIGPKGLLDILVVAPCTGNTLAKIANAITDSSVTMAVKAHLRNERPVVIAVSTNDGLGINAENIGKLLNMKNIYIVPFYQDDPINKSKSLISRLELVQDTIKEALEGKQLQPLLN